MSDSKPANTAMPEAQAIDLRTLVDYQAGTIVSRTLEKKSGGTVTLFAFDQGQELSEHSAPFNALLQVLEGQVELMIGGLRISAAEGFSVLMPANIPHAVFAATRFKMLLTMIRNPAATP